MITPLPLAQASSNTAIEASSPGQLAWYQREAIDLFEAFGTDGDQGLSQTTAESRLLQYGNNRWVGTSPRSRLALFVEQFLTLPVGLLSAAALLSYWTGGSIDAGVIMGVVLLNATIGYTTETQSARIIRSLRSIEAPNATVIRDGQEQVLPLEQVVVGDRIILRSGSLIPADARVIDSQGLTIDEAVLTGESLAVEKTGKTLPPSEIPLAERYNMVFQGTAITRGRGTAIVIATGSTTELGKIQQLVGETVTVETPLQRQLSRAGGQLVLLSSGICALVFTLGVWRGYPLLEMLKTAVSLAVAAVPEGLPAIATTTLALGIYKMRRSKIFIRDLEAVEALGSVQTLCLDKTGTLTQNKMAAAAVQLADACLPLTHGQAPLKQLVSLSAANQQDLLQLGQVALLCNEAATESPERSPDRPGLGSSSSSTETALLNLAQDLGLNAQQLQAQYSLQLIEPRQVGQPMMATYHRENDTHQGLWALKGNPREVLAQCSHWRIAGKLQRLSEGDRQTIEAQNEELSGQALRVLGFAYRQDNVSATVSSSPPPPSLQSSPANAIWLGLVGLADPVRPGIPDLIHQLHQAGMDTVMITGDQQATARAIAQEIHLNRRPALSCLDAPILTQLSASQQQAEIAQVDVFSRVSPAEKLAIVQSLQASGKIVAMTGDGINDTPALQASNVGIAMGSGGGAVVHEVANLVVADDNLQTLVQAVSQGRTIYSNIRKSVHFLLSTNLSEILVTTAITALALGPALNAMQLLWLNLVTDVFPGLALALEPSEPEVLIQPPRASDEPILKRPDLSSILSESIVISLSALAAYGFALRQYGGSNQANTVLFMALTLGQILHTFCCRSEQHPGLGSRHLARNRYVEGAIAGTLLLQLLPLAIPGLYQLLHLVPITPVDWLVVWGCAIAPLGLNELSKWWRQNAKFKPTVAPLPERV